MATLGLVEVVVSKPGREAERADVFRSAVSRAAARAASLSNSS